MALTIALETKESGGEHGVVWSFGGWMSAEAGTVRVFTKYSTAGVCVNSWGKRFHSLWL